MAKSKTFAYSASIFFLIAVAVMARHDLLPGIFMLLAAIACALRARSEWNCEQSSSSRAGGSSRNPPGPSL